MRIRDPSDKVAQPRQPAAQFAAGAQEGQVRFDTTPRQLTQRRQMNDALGDVVGETASRSSSGSMGCGPEVAQLIRIGNVGGKYKQDDQGDIDTDTYSADQLRGLLARNLSREVRIAIQSRLLELAQHREDARELTLQQRDQTIISLNTRIDGLKEQVNKAKGYIETDGKKMRSPAKFREFILPVLFGLAVLALGPVNALLNTATGVMLTLVTAAVITLIQVTNDAVTMVRRKGWKRWLLVGGMALCQAAAQMLMTAPGTDSPLFQAPALNETVGNSTALSNTTAPDRPPLTGDYVGNKWIFLGPALALGILALVLRCIDAWLLYWERRSESRGRIEEIDKDPSDDSDSSRNV